MRSIHIYTAPRQPLTRYVDQTLIGMGFSRRKATFRHHPREQVRCHTCQQLRWAKNLTVYTYYDRLHIACREGCKRRDRRR